MLHLNSIVEFSSSYLINLPSSCNSHPFLEPILAFSWKNLVRQNLQDLMQTMPMQISFIRAIREYEKTKIVMDPVITRKLDVFWSSLLKYLSSMLAPEPKASFKASEYISSSMNSGM